MHRLDFGAFLSVVAPDLTHLHSLCSVNKDCQKPRDTAHCVAIVYATKYAKQPPLFGIFSFTLYAYLYSSLDITVRINHVDQV